jgi:hypothetical protein
MTYKEEIDKLVKNNREYIIKGEILTGKRLLKPIKDIVRKEQHCYN